MIKGVIESPFFQQLSMAAAFLDLASLDHQYLVCFNNGGEAMRDHESGSSLHYIYHRLLDKPLRFGIQG